MSGLFLPLSVRLINVLPIQIVGKLMSAYAPHPSTQALRMGSLRISFEKSAFKLDSPWTSRNSPWKNVANLFQWQLWCLRLARSAARPSAVAMGDCL